MTILTEGGIRPSRIVMVEEPEQGVTPADPGWSLISDRITSFTPEFGPEQVEKSALGDYAYEYENGLEENSLTVEYDLQQWFVDGSGNPQDLCGYGFLRAAGILPSSLTIVERMSSGDQAEGPLIRPESTVEYDYGGGSGTARETRLYSVAKGCDVAEPSLTADPSEGTWAAEVTVGCEHGRSYQIDQPIGSPTLFVESTVAGDTGLTVTIESEGASTTEAVVLDAADATTPVQTTATYSDIDAIEVTDGSGNTVDHEGDIIVSESDGASTAPAPAEALAVLYGWSSYGDTYGDPGVPALGAGTMPSSEIGSDYYHVGNMRVERPLSNLFEAAGAVQEVELSLDNNVERTPNGGREQRLHHGMQSSELSLTCDGETLSHRAMKAQSLATEEDARIYFDRAQTQYVTLPNSRVSEGGRERSAGESSLEQEITIQGQDPGIQISNA